VARGGKRVLDADVDGLAAAQGESVDQVVLVTPAQAGCLLHAQARLGAVERAAPQAGGSGVQAGGLHRVVGGRRAAAEVLQGAARHPQQEQVEHDQEAELQHH